MAAEVHKIASIGIGMLISTAVAGAWQRARGRSPRPAHLHPGHQRQKAAADDAEGAAVGVNHRAYGCRERFKAHGTVKLRAVSGMEHMIGTQS